MENKTILFICHKPYHVSRAGPMCNTYQYMHSLYFAGGGGGAAVKCQSG